MRRPVLTWFGASAEPTDDALVIFDFGTGCVIGNYHRGRFVSMKAPWCAWHRSNIERWRYCTSPDHFSAFESRIAA